MKAPNMHTNAYAIRPIFGVFRDSADRIDRQDQELVKHFRGAAALFRTRVEMLVSLEHKTTAGEEESLKIMLEVLLEGKRRLQKSSV